MSKSGEEVPESLVATAVELVPAINASGLVRDPNLPLERAHAGNQTKEREGWNDNPAPFAETILNSHSSVELLSGLKGQIVVDIGAGESLAGYIIANRAEAKGYIGVDAFNAQNLSVKLNYFLDPNGNYRNKATTKGVAIEEDMLSFLKRLPDRSVSVFCSGIDYTILGVEYESEVSAEIQRVLSDDGVYVGGIVGNMSEHINLNATDGYETEESERVRVYRRGK